MAPGWSRLQGQKEASQDSDMGSRACVGFLYANPLVRVDTTQDGRKVLKEQELLKTDKELKLIREKLKNSGLQISFCADVANTCNLRKILNSGCQMLHYAGHANDNCLAFESCVETECGVAEPLGVAPLKSMFQAGATEGVITRLVFVGSCCSENSGNAFVEAGVPHVVAVRKGQSVSDRAALQFSDLFYDALINMFTVREAFETALRTVDASKFNLPKEKGDHFLLLPRDGKHDVRIFDTLLEGDFIDRTRYPPPRPPCERAVTSYKGRVGLQKVVKLLMEPKHSCVTITGERGSGKTERAIQACDYVRERHHFDAVHWADCNKVVEEEACPTPPPFSADSPGALDWSSHTVSDPCRLIGMAVGMPSPGPESDVELHRFLFKNPADDEAQPVHKALLVLENADALLERSGDARDRLVELLASLCAMGDGERLKLLVTSEQRLLTETHERFRDGSEVEAKIEPLKPSEACQFLREQMPGSFKRSELGFSSRVPLTDEMIDAAVQNHPDLMDVIREGHPGTLQRLAPTLLDNLGNGDVKAMAARCRAEFRDMPRRARPRRSSSNTSMFSHTSALTISSSNLGGPPSTPPHRPGGLATPPRPPGLLSGSYDTQIQQRGRSFLHPNGSPARTTSCGGGAGMSTSLNFHPVLERNCTDGCIAGAAGIAPAHGGAFWNSNLRVVDPGYLHPQPSLESPPPPPPQLPHRHPQAQAQAQAQQPCPHLQRLRELQGLMTAVDLSRIGTAALSEPEPPHMDRLEQQAWDVALAAGVNSACLLVWVVAAADASADGWRSHHDDGQDNDRPGAGMSGAVGLEDAPVGGGSPAVVDRVPWEFLKDALMQHLSGKLTIPSTRARGVGDDDDDFEDPYDCMGQTGIEDDGDEDSAMDGGWGEEEGSWYGRVDAKQDRILHEHELDFIRGVLEKKNRHQSGAAAAAAARTRGRGRGQHGGGINADVILVKEFAEFSSWWAPVMQTVSHVKCDWEAHPVRVHGFVGRFWADRELKRRSPGTFLLRFSEREAGKLVVSFKEHVRSKGVSHCLVKVRRGGRCCLKEGPQRWHASLRDLVMETSTLTTLYPSTPKKAAFDEETPPSVQGQLGGGGGGLGAGQSGAYPDASGLVGAEARPSPPALPHTEPPPSYRDLVLTEAEGVGRRGEAGWRGTRDAVDAGMGRSEAGSPPTYAETFRSVEPLRGME
eukprot:g2338.t2